MPPKKTPRIWCLETQPDFFFSLHHQKLCLLICRILPSLLASLFKILAGLGTDCHPSYTIQIHKGFQPWNGWNFEVYSNYFDWWSNSGEKKHVPTLGKNSLKKHVTKNPRLKTRALRLGMVQWSMALPEQNSRGPRVHMHHFPDVVVVVKGHEYTLL